MEGKKMYKESKVENYRLKSDVWSSKTHGSSLGIEVPPQSCCKPKWLIMVSLLSKDQDMNVRSKSI